MTLVHRASRYLLASIALLAVSLTASAYEVHILSGQGSESRALDKGKYELAIERLELRVKHDSRFIDIQLTNLCTAYIAVRELDKAAPVCDEAVEADGDFVGTAYNSRGVLKALQGDFVAAMQDFDRASLKSNYPVPRYNAGDNRPSMRRYGTPETESENSIEIAARNFADADRTWAAIRRESEEALAAEVR